MTELPAELFSNPVWHALHTRHSNFAITAGDACRYPSEVTPFAAVAEPSEGALKQLATLLAPGESVWIHGAQFPAVQELDFVESLVCLVMIAPNEAVQPDPRIDILPLSNADAPAMVALTDVAFPGFFRIRTCEMGTYYGVRHEGKLIAMGGERIMLDGFSEISGVCTHPAHRGKGYAASLMWRLVQDHRRRGEVSWLHVTISNQRAIDLYHHMGFTVSHRVTLHRVRLKSAS
jgi:ribosomal protein S18 acetylase RimI-like enzyme